MHVFRNSIDNRSFPEKLQIYGLQGNYLNWFKSYLTNKKQFIEGKGFKTEMLNIKCSVPLGPLLFIICINDIFADDTILFKSRHERVISGC